VQPILLAQLTDPDGPPTEVHANTAPDAPAGTSNRSIVAPPIVLQPIAITELLNGQLATPVAPISQAATGTLNLPPASTAGNDVLRNSPMAAQLPTGHPRHSPQSADYRTALQAMQDNCGARIWETTRRDFILAAHRDGLSFWNGRRLTLSMKNLNRTLAKQNFCMINYPVGAPLPHHAGADHEVKGFKLGAAKGFSGLPEKWLRKISSQLADPTDGLRFERVEEENGEFRCPSQETHLTSNC
jgi:hypothetical protein